MMIRVQTALDEGTYRSLISMLDNNDDYETVSQIVRKAVKEYVKSYESKNDIIS